MYIMAKVKVAYQTLSSKTLPPEQLTAVHGPKTAAFLDILWTQNAHNADAPMLITVQVV